MATFYFRAEEAVLNKQQQNCHLISKITAPDGTENQAVRLAAQNGLEDKFGGRMTLNPITDHEVFQHLQSNPNPDTGSFNLNPGVLLWYLVRMD